MSALETLRGPYADRTARAAEWRRDGGKVVGYVGADVPRELIAAAGLLPLRLHGGGPGSGLADEILGPGVDPPARLVLAGLLDPGRLPIDFLLLCHDSDSTVRLYTSLRALGDREGLPETHFLDLLHLPAETTAGYNLDRLAELLATLEAWAGRPVTTDELLTAIAETNESRRLIGRLLAFRRAAPPLIGGADALAAIGAGTGLPAGEFNHLLSALLDELPDGDPRPGRRLYLTGSGHASNEVYQAIEERGWVVIGEDHDWGEALADGLVDENIDPLAALSQRYHTGSALGRRHGSNERAAFTAQEAEAGGAELVLAWIRAGDDAHAWDVPEQRRRLAERGLTLAVLDRRPYDRVELVGALP